jgi:hypothetical protein
MPNSGVKRLKKVGVSCGMDSNTLGWGPAAGFSEQNNKLSDSIKGRGISKPDDGLLST